MHATLNGINFQSNALINESTINNLKNPSSSCSHVHCKCYFIPPHITGRINAASQEVRHEHAEIVAEHKHDMHRRFRQQRAATVIQPHNAQPHEIFGLHNKTPDEKAESLQLLYDARNGTDLPGKKVKSPKDNQDASVVRAFDGGKVTAKFFSEKLNRNSIDNRGMAIKSSVHYDVEYNNAFFNGSQMVYGDGDGLTFGDFTTDIDVIGHELSHGVTQYTANLEYQDQSGALNEHISDVFGSCIKQYQRNQKSEDADWFIGDVVLLGPGALRSMKKPGTAYDTELMGKDPQPDHMGSYVKTKDDEGGVHINSGIPNRAFYLVNEELKGYSWEAPAKIWYDTITCGKLKEKATFIEFANLTVKRAGKLYGAESAEQKAVRKAWMTVGVL